MVRKTGRYIIAFHFMADISEVELYQSPLNRGTRALTRLYQYEGEIFACPLNDRAKLPDAYQWRRIGEHYGRTVWQAIGTNV